MTPAADRVPVLLYHGITDRSSPAMAPFAVPPRVFAEHLDLLDELGLTVVPLSDLADAIATGVPLPPRSAVITFDDGYADFASEALPRLAARKAPATLYVTTGWLEGGASTGISRPSDRFLGVSDLPALRDAGIEIGGHSHTHPQMDTLPRPGIREELQRCKTLLEDALSEEVTSFAYPHGYNDRRVRRVVREVGFRTSTAVANRIATVHDDPMRIPRLMLGPQTSRAELRRLLTEPGAGRGRTAVRAGLRVGWRTVRRTRAVITRRPGRATW
jgi:peptidoglycan/xylan/chitin deacetylase (PgdA/CDA1 family)